MFRITVIACVLTTVIARHPPFRVIFEWDSIQFNWPSESALQEAISCNDYVAVNNAISGVKLWKDKMYLTIPRWKNGVPVTLAVTSVTYHLSDSGRNITDPRLDAFPNWDMQTLDNCSAFQSVSNMEIDPLGRMWVLDTGRTETMTRTPVSRCPPRLVILDLENNGTVLRNFVFPAQVASPNSSYLNDIVLDHEDGGMAFITDSGEQPGMIIYSLRENKARKVLHTGSTMAEEAEVRFSVAGTSIISPIDMGGIALSPPDVDRLVYYSRLSSLHLYSVPASVLKNDSVKNIEPYVEDLGQERSPIDGMVMSNTGDLYFGLLSDDSIVVWETQVHPHFVNGQRLIARDHALAQWPGKFAIDNDNGWIYCVTNRLQNFILNQVDISKPNYRIIRSDTSMKNYQYFANGTSPELPVVRGAVDHITISEIVQLIDQSLA